MRGCLTPTWKSKRSMASTSRAVNASRGRDEHHDEQRVISPACGQGRRDGRRQHRRIPGQSGDGGRQARVVCAKRCALLAAKAGSDICPVLVPTGRTVDTASKGPDGRRSRAKPCAGSHTAGEQRASERGMHKRIRRHIGEIRVVDRKERTGFWGSVASGSLGGLPGLARKKS